MVFFFELFKVQFWWFAVGRDTVVCENTPVQIAHPVFGIRDYELPTGFHQPTIFLSEPKRTTNNFVCRKSQCLLIINIVTVVFTQDYCLFYINFKGFNKHEMFNYWKNK